MNQKGTKISFQQRLDESFQKYPHHVAIESGAYHITYSQLENKATCICNWITLKGIPPESFIGICFDHSIDIIPVMIGILKARCVFIIMDTSLPRQRLLNLARLTHLQIIFTRTKNKKILFEDNDSNTQSIQELAAVIVDDMFYQNGHVSSSAKESQIIEYNREDKVYIYFTSGTTGMPKAIVGKNKSLLHFIDWEIETFSIDETFRFSQWITPGFDAFLRDVFTPLCAGAVICIPPRKVMEMAGHEIIHWLNSRHIGLIHCVPSIFRLINVFTDKDAAKENFKALKMVVMAGEKIIPIELKRWFEMFDKRVQLINLYGSTETTMAKTCYFISPSDGELAIVPVGKPIPGARILILDEEMQACPKKFIGEIYIRTPFRTHGYHNDPQANKDKFIPNPFTQAPNDLLHKTGDLGRLLDDDNIEVLRRVDRQVKIRGVRVEPEEIENILLQHPAVAEVSVIGKKNSADETYLCAYFVPRQARSDGRAMEDITAEELGNYLAADLPSYMVPAFFIRLEKMPLTANGKIDRSALPEVRLELDHYIPPANEIEKKLAAIWSQVLDMDRDKISMDANFFRVGGHSLNATILTSRIHSQLGIKIPLAEIFKTPSIRGLAHYINTAALSENPHLSIKPVETREYYPLSSAQKRLYFLQQLDPHGIAYNMPMVHPLGKSIDAQGLESTIKKLIARHETLRTSFIQVGDEPFQEVHDQAPFEMEYYDLPTENTEDTEDTRDKRHHSSSSIHHLIQSFIRPFDLSRAPLLRCGLIRMANGEYTWLVDIHHIVTDGTSQIILTEDFFALSQGRDLAPLPLQYKDFSQWQNQLFESGAIKGQKEYWLSLLAGEIPRLDLPVDYKRPDTFNFAGSNYTFILDRDDASKFRELGNKVGATLYMNLLAALNVLFYKYTGQTDIIIGSGIAGRPHDDLQDIVGMFVNVLAMRNYPNSEKSYEYFLKEVTANSIKNFENQDVQFEDLVEKLDIQRDLSRNPVFDVAIQVQNFREVKEIKKSRQVGRIPAPSYTQTRYKKTTSKFDLTFFVNEMEDNIYMTIEYYTGIFKEETIQRLESHFKAIVKNVIKIPSIILEDIDILSEEEKHQILQEFNDTEIDYPINKTIHQLFEEQAEKSPDNIALVGPAAVETLRATSLQIQITYRQLSGQSARLAGLLIEKGVLADGIVGIMMERSVEMIIGILGILKSGGAYMPIDPDYPQDRIDYMLADSNAKILLGMKECLEEIIVNCQLLIVNCKLMSLPQAPLHHSSFIIHHSNQLAYIIYTSGTTGKPKGVLIEHRHVARLLFNDRFQFDFNHLDVWTMFHSYCFDFSVWEMYGTLLYGGKLVIIPLMTARDPGGFLEVLKKEQVTVLNQTPSAFYRLISAEARSHRRYLRLKYVIFGGEALAPGQLRTWREKYPDTRLINMYGITETTVHVTFKEIGSEEIEANISNIGKPIPTLSCYVMDPGLKLLPAGASGELCVGGEGVARGYLNRPELSAEKFVRNPYKPGERLYRSGDRARCSLNGEMEYRGRLDHQVKIRGFRIEPGEIEKELLAHNGIKEAAVIDRLSGGSESDDRYLCAYFAPLPDFLGRFTGETLRGFLLTKLPDYMIPAYFMELETIPLTPNGKVDRKSLPQPEVTKTDTYLAPRTGTEIKLAEIWSRVLGIKKDIIGIDNDFFQLGGHSLKVTTLTSLIHKELNVKISLQELFKTRTIRGQAEYISHMAADNKDTFKSIEPSEQKEYYKLSSAQERLYFLQQMDPGGTAYNIPLVVTLVGNIEITKLEETVKKLIARHGSLRTSFEVINEDPVQRIHEHVEFEIEQLGISIMNFIRPFDLSKAPLMRVGLIEIEKDRHILLVDMHHIISDGMSTQVLLQDFSALYAGEKLPGINLQYKDYTEWQNRERVSKKILEQGEYWKKQYEGEIPVLELPIDYARPAIQGFEGDRINFEINAETSGALKTLSQEMESTLYIVLLALYTIFLAKLCSQEDIVIGSPIAGRRHADLEKIIGMFVNTLAFRNYPSKEKCFMAFLGEVKEIALKGFENQEYQYEDLVEQISVNRDAGRNPLFDAMLLLQNTDSQGIEIPDLKFVPYKYENKTSKFDLTLFAVEVDGKLHLTFEYSTNLFKRETVERFIIYFDNIIRGVGENRRKRISDFEIITEEEKKRILTDFNNTETVYPKNKTIHQLFEEQASKTPDHVGLVGAGPRVCPNCITYRQLNERSDYLAQLLIEKGVLADSIVGIMMERSVEMIIGILGILKSGGAYMPIDPDYPRERIDYMLKDSGTTILLTDYEKEIIVNCQLLIVNCKLKTPPKAPSHHSSFIIHHSNHLAYVIYTSGSTGNPKGVLIQHGAVVNRLNWMQQMYPLGSNDTILQKTSFTFDVSVWELFWWSFNGARLCLLGPGEEKDPAAIIESIVRNHITTMHFVPSMLNAFLAYLESSRESYRFVSLRHVFASGEALGASQIEQFYRLVKVKGNRQVRLINLYGPTEATIDVSYFNCSADHHVDTVTAPIGKPIHNIRLYIINKDTGLQPIGIAGELCIAGVGLARGYLNNPELTAQKFKRINRSYESYRTYTFYKTGDLARWLHDPAARGDYTIEFLGRIDYQVKIRGFRIELGEIENELLKHEDIKEAVVAARKDKNGNAYLCGYIVSRKEFTASHLRSYLSQRLPDYMLPSYFVPLDKIPFTASGKVDRKVLPEPGLMGLSSARAYIAPTTMIEKKLVAIWQKVLGINTVSINDNFFEIGGDSIKTIQIISQMKKAGYKIEMKNIFRYPRISDLALSVKKIERIADQSPIIGPVPLTPIQEWFFENKKTENHHFNQAVMLYFEEGVEEEALKLIFSRLQEHHDSLRMIYPENNGKIIQIDQGLDHPLSFQVFDYRNQKDSRSLIENKANEIQADISLETGPLMKLALFHPDDGDRLLIVVHHLVIDGVSWRILFEDIDTLYRQYKKGEPLILPLKTDSFKTWSEKLCAYADSDQFLKEKNVWAELESKSIPELMKDFENEDNYMKDVESLSFSLGETETRQLLTKVNEAFGTRIDDILLTALGLAVKTVYGNDRLLIALEGHGREEILGDIDVSRTVGWFTSLYPVLLDFSHGYNQGQHNLSRQIKEVKESLHRITNRGIGYGILKYLTAEKYKKDIHFRLNPPIIFNYLGQFDEDFEHRFFKIANESPGYTISGNARRDAELEISGSIISKRLNVSITYSTKQYKQETIAALLKHFKEELVAIITYCSAREKKEPTPSDLSFPGISIDALDSLQKQHSYQIEDIYTLTPMQEGMLFYALYENKDRAAYFEQMSYRLHGELNVPAVEKSLNELFKRHDVLRTFFVYEGLNRPLQVVLKNQKVEFHFEDLRKSISDREMKENLARQSRNKDRQRSFDLGKDVLMRATVLRLDVEEYQVIWSFHHILMDGWCVGILTSEFFEIYTGYLENRTYQLPTVKPYRTYIQWLEKQEKNNTRNYWQEYLRDYEDIAGIPKARYLTFAHGYKQAGANAVLEEDKTLRLHKTANKNHVTLNTFFQAVWGIVLSKYNNKRDVVFGAVVSGRPPDIEGVETMVGCFINTIPVRITFEQKTTFSQLLRIIQDRAIASEPHHYYSLAEIQATSSLKQNLLDHIIEFQNYPPVERIEGVGDQIRKNKTTETIKFSNINMSEQSNYDFNVMVVPGVKVAVAFSYNANVYDSRLVNQVGIHSLNAIDQIVNNENITIDEITLISREEKQQILFEFNNNTTGFPPDKTIYHFVEKYGRITPDHISVISTLNLSYRELNERANQLAILLRNNGIQRDEPVGILMERSEQMVESILAVWKAGGAYIPLDTAYPPGRTTDILQDSGAKVLITRRIHIDSQFEKEYKGIIVKLDNPYPGMPGDAANQAIPNLAADHCMSSLAYVIYTSGSTGKPKGVMIEHAGMMNHIQAKITDLQLTEKSIAAQNATHTFDISVWQFFVALTLGGTTVIYPNELIMDPGKFVSRVTRDQITILEVVPSYLSVLLDDTGESKVLPLSLQYLLVTGEEIKPFLVKKWFEKYPGIKIVNAYGPTEASDDITHYIMHNAPDLERIPIGKPLQNMHIYIVDNNMQLCPIGVKGEICASGIAVGRGYLGDEEKTKQVFMKDPFIEEKGVRLYKTGDLGCWLPDGNIEFFGRKDHQVKIRGFRIELGEIEQKLLNHPRIQEVVVVDKEDKTGNKYLCAYMVTHPGNLPGAAELKQYLSGSLPGYMIPAHFVRLEKIPLTSSGKIDRKALPTPDETGGVQKHTAPTNPVEEKLAEIWSEILEIEKSVIGIEHSFFDLGGHSLKAIVLVSKIKKIFNIYVPLAELFNAPTVEALARYIRAAEEEPLTAANERLVKLKAGAGYPGNMFLIHDGTGEVDGYLEFCRQIPNELNIWGLRFHRDGTAAPHNITIQNFARTYITDMKQVQPNGPYHIAGWSVGGIIAFEIAAQLEQNNEQVAFLALIDSNPPLNHLTKKPTDFKLESEPGFVKDHSPGKESITNLKFGKAFRNTILSYKPSGKVHAPIHYIAAGQSENVKKEHWKKYSAGRIDYYEIEGDHFSIFKMPRVIELAKLFSKIVIKKEKDR